MRHAESKTLRLFLSALVAMLIITLGMLFPAPFARAASSGTSFSAVQPNSPSALPAATYTVTTTADSGVGSLRQAILDSNAGGGSNTVNFSGISYPATITLASALPDITTTVAINGPGASSLAVSGNNAFRVFETLSPITLNISGLTIRDGNASNNDGGGIRVQNPSAQATLTSVSIISNTATGSSGRGGGLFANSKAITVTDSLFLNNVASGPGGGGATNLFTGTLTISNTTFSGNRATGGSGGAIGSPNVGTLRVGASTFFSNTGIGGGAVAMVASSFFTNTTLVGNSAPSFGAAILVSGSSTQFVNSTIYGNSGDHEVYNNGGTLTLKNSIVAFPTIGDTCNATITNGGNNIDSGTSCGWGGVSGSLGSTDPKLAPLGNYGGPTRTMALFVGSPAINLATANCPQTDQRGVTRSSTCDSGAFEGAWHRLFLPLLVR